ncbi:MerR family transcriptional regulator [Mucilaginibacter sp. L3T2-6]|uniref:MerR family transcriptional regulator n=1 Tax=Mucilaginibacter sp. L3T2-6 TaxID=3062491 RepID=UPI0026768C64|nr:MerR family transcriptional regulator [Mucilaginibacter sp. L3T2-6]MDO3642927.1 MerR family transcriptional regulator [Mucilaginibacter sp. L3T2-6]MDV6215252.1 MerR family transcriptional regulator [Mucilaginibacter sp. L3T2-6]
MNYSISDLEQLSGVSVHNIRIWERRYGALTPSRTSGNVRFYDDDQLKRLLSIAGLYHAGHKISKACSLSAEDMGKLLREEVSSTLPTENRYSYFISQIISNALVFNENGVNQLITKSFEQSGVTDTYKHVIYPMLVRVGLMWLTEKLCPAQEHFLSSIIRQKLFVAIDSIQSKESTAKSKWLLFLPEDEDHDIGLLLANYLLRSAGHQVTYLGPKVPLSAVDNTVAATGPQNLMFFMTRLRPVDDAQLYLNRLTASFPDHIIYFSGNRKVLSSVKCAENIHWLESLPDFEKLIGESL